MKYDDDELAEAAILLAHEDVSQDMPPALQEQILAQASAAAAEVRFTTTKGAAVVVEEPLEEPTPRRSVVRTWGGWFAAAACVAFAVYHWRVHTLEPSTTTAAARPSASAASPREIALEAASGGRIGSVRWDAASSTWVVAVGGLGRTAEDEHYRVWLSSTDAEHATAVGSFSCSGDCGERTFSIGSDVSVDSVRRVWVTRGPRIDPVSAPLAGRIVAEGSVEPPP